MYRYFFKPKPTYYAHIRSQAGRQVDNLLREFLDNVDYKEAKLCVSEIKYDTKEVLFVNKSIRYIIQKKKAHVPKFVDLYKYLLSEHALTPKHFEKG